MLSVFNDASCWSWSSAKADVSAAFRDCARRFDPPWMSTFEIGKPQIGTVKCEYGYSLLSFTMAIGPLLSRCSTPRITDANELVCHADGTSLQLLVVSSVCILKKSKEDENSRE